MLLAQSLIRACVFSPGDVPDQAEVQSLSRINSEPPPHCRALARIQKLPVQNDHFSKVWQSSSYLSHL